jgi:cyclase
MLTRRIIPCLDTLGGRVVKGVRFEGLRDAGHPLTLARRYEDEGSDELVLLDVSATREERRTCVELVALLRRHLAIPLTVGGGIRTIDDASRLLDAGADRIGVNSAAIESPEIITGLADRFGTQCVVVAIDALRHGASWRVVARSGSAPTTLDAPEWATRAAEYGAGEILLTSIDRDGGRSGYDLELIRGVASVVGCPVIASGGAAGPEHMLEAFRAGADAVLAATIFHDGHHDIGSVKSFLSNACMEIRA